MCAQIVIHKWCRCFIRNQQLWTYSIIHQQQSILSVTLHSEWPRQSGICYENVLGPVSARSVYHHLIRYSLFCAIEFHGISPPVTLHSALQLCSLERLCCDWIFQIQLIRIYVFIHKIITIQTYTGMQANNQQCRIHNPTFYRFTQKYTCFHLLFDFVLILCQICVCVLFFVVCFLALFVGTYSLSIFPPFHLTRHVRQRKKKWNIHVNWCKMPAALSIILFSFDPFRSKSKIEFVAEFSFFQLDRTVCVWFHFRFIFFFSTVSCKLNMYRIQTDSVEPNRFTKL